MIYNIATNNIDDLSTILKLKKSSEVLKIANQMKSESSLTSESTDEEYFEYVNPVKYSGQAAMITIEGAIVDESPWAEFYGATSSTRVAAQVQRIAKDYKVKYIDLFINSPGGSASAMDEIISLLKNSGKIIRFAYIGKMACSAGYGIASTAQRLIAKSYSEIGSIGTYAELYDDRGWLEMIGVKRKVYLAAISPDKIDHPAYGGGDKGDMRIQESVNKAGLSFVNIVANNRGEKPEDVLANYGQGLVFDSSEALRRGMIDAVNDSINLISKYSDKKLSAKLLKEKIASFKSSFKNLTNGELKNMTPEEIQAAIEEILNKLMDFETRLSAVEEAVGADATTDEEPANPDGEPTDPGEGETAASAEVKRIMSLDKAAVKGYEALLNSAKYGPNKMNALQYKAAVLDAMQNGRKDKQAAFFANSQAASSAGAGLGNAPPAVPKTKDEARAAAIAAAAEKRRTGK
jgi:ClpP class serine protease